MLGKIYEFQSAPDGFFIFLHNGKKAFQFTRQNLREVFESYALDYGFSSNWVGSLLRTFNKSFPLPLPVSTRTDLERLIYKIGVQGIVDHLKNKGYKFTKSLDVPDVQLIHFLETQGYEFESYMSEKKQEEFFEDKERIFSHV